MKETPTLAIPAVAKDDMKDLLKELANMGEKDSSWIKDTGLREFLQPLLDVFMADEVSLDEGTAGRLVKAWESLQKQMDPQVKAVLGTTVCGEVMQAR